MLYAKSWKISSDLAAAVNLVRDLETAANPVRDLEMKANPVRDLEMKANLVRYLETAVNPSKCQNLPVLSVAVLRIQSWKRWLQETLIRKNALLTYKKPST